MKTNVFFLISLIFYLEISCSIALECYSCLNTGHNTTECQDKFSNNGTSIKKVNVTTSDALCTKMLGKLNTNEKFTFRGASPNGCPRSINITDIGLNGTDLKIVDVNIYCCNKHLCNRGISQSMSTLLLTIGIYFSFFN